jgi:hypothetical protein
MTHTPPTCISTPGEANNTTRHYNTTQTPNHTYAHHNTTTDTTLRSSISYTPPTWISTQGGVSGMAAAMKPRSAKMPPDIRMKVQMRHGHV